MSSYGLSISQMRCRSQVRCQSDTLLLLARKSSKYMRLAICSSAVPMCPPTLSCVLCAHSAGVLQAIIVSQLFTSTQKVVFPTTPCHAFPMTPLGSRRHVDVTCIINAVHSLGADFLQENAAGLAELAIATLPLYEDAQSQKAVLRVLQAALQQEPFLKAFAGALVRYEGPRTSPQVSKALKP